MLSKYLSIILSEGYWRDMQDNTSGADREKKTDDLKQDLVDTAVSMGAVGARVANPDKPEKHEPAGDARIHRKGGARDY